MTNRRNRRVSPEEEQAIMYFSAEYNQYRGPMTKVSILREFLARLRNPVGIRQAQNIMAKAKLHKVHKVTGTKNTN